MTEKTIELGIISMVGFENLFLGSHGTGLGSTPLFRKLTESEVAELVLPFPFFFYFFVDDFFGREGRILIFILSLLVLFSYLQL